MRARGRRAWADGNGIQPQHPPRGDSAVCQCWQRPGPGAAPRTRSSLLTASPAGWGSLRSGAGGLERAGCCQPRPTTGAVASPPPGRQVLPQHQAPPCGGSDRPAAPGARLRGPFPPSPKERSRGGCRHPRPSPSLWPPRPGSPGSRGPAASPRALPERCLALSSASSETFGICERHGAGASPRDAPLLPAVCSRCGATRPRAPAPREGRCCMPKPGKQSRGSRAGSRRRAAARARPRA